LRPGQKEEDSQEFQYGQSSSVAEKDKPNFAVSGKLAADTNTYKGVVIKYSEPPEARKPKVKWRLYPFKGEETLRETSPHNSTFCTHPRPPDTPIYPVYSCTAYSQTKCLPHWTGPTYCWHPCGPPLLLQATCCSTISICGLWEGKWNNGKGYQVGGANSSLCALIVGFTSIFPKAIPYWPGVHQRYLHQQWQDRVCQILPAQGEGQFGWSDEGRVCFCL
jgi:hypothetical protein